MIRLIIADDHDVVRRGLRMTIDTEEDMTLVGEATNGKEAVELAVRTRPDLILLDIRMPVLDGIEAAKLILEEMPQANVLLLTSFGDDAHLHQAFQVGVTGYLLKDMGGDDLVEAIRGAAQGKPQLHPEIAQRLMRQMPAPQTPLDTLTARERDVLKLLGHGLSNKEVAQELSLTEVTIKGYVSAILGKLYVSDRTQAALLAVRYGLVKLDDLPYSSY